MATFVNDTTNVMVERWGGFLPCAITGSDCLLPGELIVDLIIICNPISNGPIKSQAYCHCDLGLAGYECSDITPAAIKRSIIFILCTFVGSLTTGVCLGEIAARRTTFKMNPVNMSLLFSTLGSVANLLWGALGLYFIFAASSNPGFSASRKFYFSVVLPTTLASTLSGAMVISLAWRKVVNDPQISGTKRANPTREKHIRNFIVIVCVSLFAFASLIPNVSVAALFLTVSYLITGFIFIWFGRSFLKYVSSVAKPTTGEGKKVSITGAHMQMCLTAAITARRSITRRIFTIVVASIFLVLAQNKIGAPGSPDGFEIGAIAILGITCGAALIPFAVTKYARTVRRAGLTRKKSMASKSRATGTTSSGAGLFSTTQVQPDN